MNPLNYSFIFVLAMIAVAFISFRLGGPEPNTEDRMAPQVGDSASGKILEPDI